VLLLTAASAVACHRGARTPGASFVGASLLEPLSEAEAAHDELLRADIARADSVARRGMPEGLAANFTDDVVYLRGGLPILRGRDAARAIVAAESLATPFAVRWQPVRAEASRDGGSGYSYGYTIVSTSPNGSPAIRIDRYIAYWRHLPAGWRIAAYAETYGAPPSALEVPPQASSAAIPDVGMPKGAGPLEAIRTSSSRATR
jgi:hypothetical protein